MPKKTSRDDKVRPPTDRVMQWGDMPAEAHKDVNAQVREMGMAKSGAPEQRAKLEASRDNPESSEKGRGKAANRIASLDSIEPHLVDKPITHQGAAARRVGLVKQGAERTLAEGTDPGHNWYFAHHGKLADVAQATGQDKHRVIAASAVMSPQNNPEQELTAVHNLAQAHRPEASMHITQEAADAGAALKDPVHLHDWVGRDIHPSALSATQLAGASSVGVREGIRTNGFDLSAVAKGGVKGNVEQAIGVLRGDIGLDKAIDPQSSPKVWSYHNNIAQSVRGSAEQVESNRRMDVATGLEHHREVSGQQGMNLYPELRGATHGPLNPTGTTAEDTWQQAISTGQRLPVVEIEGRKGRAARQSPAKFSVGEGGNANQKALRSPEGMTGVGESASMHAWQNQATVRAAGTLSRESGEIVPSTGVQAGGWTEARRHAGKAIEEQQVTRKVPGAPVQLSMFTEKGNVTKAASLPKSNIAAGGSIARSPAEHATDHAAALSLRERAAHRDANQGGLF